MVQKKKNTMKEIRELLVEHLHLLCILVISLVCFFLVKLILPFFLYVTNMLWKQTNIIHGMFHSTTNQYGFLPFDNVLTVLTIIYYLSNNRYSVHSF